MSDFTIRVRRIGNGYIASISPAPTARDPMAQRVISPEMYGKDSPDLRAVVNVMIEQAINADNEGLGR